MEYGPSCGNDLAAKLPQISGLAYMRKSEKWKTKDIFFWSPLLGPYVHFPACTRFTSLRSRKRLRYVEPILSLSWTVDAHYFGI